MELTQEQKIHIQNLCKDENLKQETYKHPFANFLRGAYYLTFAYFFSYKSHLLAKEALKYI